MPRKAKTPELPAMTGEGVERPSIPAIERQAEKVSDACESRKQATEFESNEREKLLKLMDEHKQIQYKCESGKIVYVDDKRKAKIKSSFINDED
jgi:hypothetical protein